jgi:hypothetical protein
MTVLCIFSSLSNFVLAGEAVSEKLLCFLMAFQAVLNILLLTKLRPLAVEVVTRQQFFFLTSLSSLTHSDTRSQGKQTNTEVS